MSEYAGMDQRQLHRVREQALNRMRYAWYAAALSSGFAALLILWIGADTGEWLTVLPYLGSLALLAFLGYRVGHAHSQLAAWMLLALFAASIIARWVQLGQVSNVILLALVGFAYVNGLRGAMDYPEIEEEYRAREQARVEKAHAQSMAQSASTGAPKPLP